MTPAGDTPRGDGYDVIVVGAGLGGMTAASLLAKRGLYVLLIEQQGKPGSSCISFRGAPPALLPELHARARAEGPRQLARDGL